MLFGVVQAVTEVKAVPLLEVTVDGRKHDISTSVYVAADQIAVLTDVQVDVQPWKDQ
jgi:hypothetical protein